MLNRSVGNVLAVALLAAASVSLWAQETESPTTTTTGVTDSTMTAASLTATPEELKVLASIHHDNAMEIEMGKLAADNGESSEVRQFGERLVQDHQDADKRVMELSKRMNVTLPDEKPMAEKDHAKMEKLRNTKAADFDAAFAKMMAADHRKSIQTLKASLPKLGASPTKTLATEVLAVIQEHERIANNLAANPPQRVPKQPS